LSLILKHLHLLSSVEATVAMYRADTVHFWDKAGRRSRRRRYRARLNQVVPLQVQREQFRVRLAELRGMLKAAQAVKAI
jgi:hypothetical protein